MELDTTKTTQQLLSEIADCQRRAQRRERITAIACIILALTLTTVCAVVIPRIMGIAGRIETALGDIEEITAGAETFFTNANAMVEENSQAMTDAVQKLNGVDIDTLNDAIGQLNEVVGENSDNVTEAIKKLNGVDFEKLNKAITDLSDAVHPLGEFARLFQR